MKKRVKKKKFKNRSDDREFTQKRYEHLHNQLVTNKQSVMKKKDVYTCGTIDDCYNTSLIT